MKKILSLAILLLMPLLFAPDKAEAAPLYSGTVNFTLGDSTTTTLDWAVYAQGADPFGINTANNPGYVYAYTLNGWSGSTGSDALQIQNINGVLTGQGFGPSDVTPTFVFPSQADITNINLLGHDYVASNGNLITNYTGAISAGLSTTTWWTSTTGPATASAWLNGQTASGLIYAPNTLGTPAPPPGVPEPQTWALLIALMGFSTLWLRRRRDDEPLQIAIAA